MPKIKVSNGELNYEVHGSGEPLVLLHCGFFDSRNWEYQIDSFSKKFKTYTYDQRGFGESSVPIEAYSPVEDLKEFLDARVIKEAHLVGHSIGGQIALDFSSIYPNRVKKLVVLSSTLDGYPMSEAFMKWMASLFTDPQPEAVAQKVLTSGMLTVIEKDTALMGALYKILLHNAAKILTWKNSEVHWPHVSGTDYLTKISTPTLALLGEKETEDMVGIFELLKTKVPKIKTKMLVGLDHMMNFGSPELFNQTVLDFLVE